MWRSIENEQAMEIVMDKADASDACVALIDESSRRWREAEGNYRDDITAMVVYLPETIATLRERKSSQERSASPAATPQQTGACAGGDK